MVYYRKSMLQNDNTAGDRGKSWPAAGPWVV